MEPGICNDLKDTQDLCKQSGPGLHLDLCPETCGVCQAVKEANCHDTVLDGECAKLMAEKDICNVRKGHGASANGCSFFLKGRDKNFATIGAKLEEERKIWRRRGRGRDKEEETD